MGCGARIRRARGLGEFAFLCAADWIHDGDVGLPVPPGPHSWASSAANAGAPDFFRVPVLVSLLRGRAAERQQPDLLCGTAFADPDFLFKPSRLRRAISPCIPGSCVRLLPTQIPAAASDSQILRSCDLHVLRRTSSHKRVDASVRE